MTSHVFRRVVGLTIILLCYATLLEMVCSIWYPSQANSTKEEKGIIHFTFCVDDFSQIADQPMVIKQGDLTVAMVLVSEPQVTVSLWAGTYEVGFPIPKRPLQYENQTITIQAGETLEQTVTYKELEAISYGNDIAIRSGNEENWVYQLAIRDNALEITYRNQVILSKKSGNSLYARVRVKRGETILYEKGIPYGKDWLSEPEESLSIPVQIGDCILLYQSQDCETMEFESTLEEQPLGEDELPYYQMQNGEEKRYFVTPYGLMPKGESTEEGAAFFKNRLQRAIENYLQGKTKQELLDPFQNAETRNAIMSAWEKLFYTDYLALADKIEEMTRGHYLAIVSEKGCYQWEAGSEIEEEDLRSLVKVVDSMDGVQEKDVTITTDLQAEVPGTYEVHYEVLDAEGNPVTCTITIVIIENSQKSIEPTEPEKPTKPETSSKPSSESTTSSKPSHFPRLYWQARSEQESIFFFMQWKEKYCFFSFAKRKVDIYFLTGQK